MVAKIDRLCTRHYSKLFICVTLFNLYLITHCCITNYPYTQWLRRIFIIIVSESQEFRHSLAGSSGSGFLRMLKPSVGWGWIYLSIYLGRDLPPGLLTELPTGVSFWLAEATLGSLPHRHLQKAVHSMADGFIRASKGDGPEGMWAG